MPFKDFVLSETLTASDVDTYLMGQALIRCTSATRPTPVDGMRIFETDTRREMIYRSSSASWVFYRGVDLFVRKTADETYNSNGLHSDAELALSIEGPATYLLTATIFGQSPAAADWGIAFFISSSSHTWSAFAPHPGDATNTSVDQARLSVNRLGVGNSANITGYGADTAFIVRGTVRSTASGGVQFAWSQQAANAGPTVVRADSSLHLKRVA